MLAALPCVGISVPPCRKLRRILARPCRAYEFQVGGCQVLNGWPRDRKGRQFARDDIRHYCRVVCALKETIRLMREIDAAIPEWPIT